MPWLWSLGVEELFYLFVPLLFVLLRRLRGDRARLAVLGALWMSALAIRLFLYLHHPAGLSGAYVRTHTRSDTLAAGVVVPYLPPRWGDPIPRLLEGPPAPPIPPAPTPRCPPPLLNPPP